ncbi:Uncharacterised protein [uncultured archaeon]|nr:Uncharacterised protein [uncultured archaeon]
MPLEYKNNLLLDNLHANFLSTENKTLFSYGLVLFLIPLFPLHQLIIGTIVNALLIKSAISMKTKNVFLLALIPSIAVAAGGVLFGGLTSSTIYMLPFIWAGNATLMLFMRRMFARENKNYLISSLAGATAKTALLFSAAFVMLAYSFVPALFLTAFGILQFGTAVAGAIAVGAADKFIFKK